MFALDFGADIPEGDPVSFALASAPSGALIDSANVVRWTPAALGSYRFTIVARDGRGGKAVQRIVVPVNDNHPPTITSTPRDTIQIGREFVYEVEATDPDDDLLTFALVAPFPDRMTIDSDGVVRWTPDGDDLANSPHPYTVRADDGRGGVDEKTFTIRVVADPANHDPAITTKPKKNALAKYEYQYDAHASDADNDPLRWSLVEAPHDMVVDPRTGAVRWVPESEDAGTHDVQLRVTDPYGGIATQDWTITVRAANRPPRITSWAPNVVYLNELYVYETQATDPDDDPLRFTLDDASLNRGMAIDADTGKVTWTPTTAGVVRVTITAWDLFDFGCVEVYDLNVLDPANRPPEISSNGPLEAEVGQLYEYDVEASDPNDAHGNVIRMVDPTG